MFRKTISKMLKEELGAMMREARLGRKLTQERMAELLDMDTRSYQDLERGRSLCGTVSLLLFVTAFPETDLSSVCELIKDLLSGDSDED